MYAKSDVNRNLIIYYKMFFISKRMIQKRRNYVVNKKNKGITLIALVLTIILLFILASVSLVTLFGEEGIIAKARRADLVNDWGIVTDHLKNEIISFNTIKIIDHLPKMPIEYLEESGFIDEDYIVQVKKLTSVELKTGKGDLEKGDIYQIQGQKLVYIDKEGNTIFLSNLGELGTLPVYMYFQTEVSSNSITLGINQITDSFKITVTNKEQDKITHYSIPYEITIEPEEENQEMIFEVEVDGTVKESGKIEGTLKGKQESTDQHSICLKVKQGKQALDTNRLRLRIKTMAPIEKEEVFSLEVKNDNLIDHSSQAYHGKLKNGTKIIQDEQGKYALSFDGIDDYIELPTLSGNVNWNKGVIVEAEAVYEATNQNSMILMLGNGYNLSEGHGKNHVILQNIGTSGRIGFHIQGKAEGKEYAVETKNNVITFNQKMKIKVAMKEVASAYSSNVYINNTEASSTDSYMSSVVNPIQNVDRKENYLGKSSWPSDGYFKGKIYSIKLTLTNGTVIFDYDLNR